MQIFIKNENIDNYNLVYFRRTSKVPLANTIAYYLKKKNIKFFDTGLVDAEPFGNKLNYLIKLALEGLPVIPTFYCSTDQIKNNEDKIIKDFNLPVVAKDLNMQRGVGVHLIKTKDDFQKLVSKNRKRKFLFQKFIKSDEEYRIMVLGESVGVFEQKVRTDENEFRSNAALGAREDFLNPSDTPQSIKNTALKAAKILKIQIAGVDIMIEKETAKEWLLEVNRGPGITYEDKNSPEIMKVAQFLQKELGE